jgi:hypothetical protein
MVVNIPLNFNLLLSTRERIDRTGIEPHAKAATCLMDCIHKDLYTLSVSALSYDLTIYTHSLSETALFDVDNLLITTSRGFYAFVSVI